MNIEQDYRELTIDAKWVQQPGIELHDCSSSFLRPKYEYVMHYAIDLVTAREWKLSSKNVWTVFEKKQKLFIEWLIINGLDELFLADVDLHKSRALDIFKATEQPLKVPAITHLLWLRFVGIHSLRDAKRNGYVRPRTVA